jgi:hypothetical protein
VRAASLARLALGTTCLAVPRGMLAAIGGPDRNDHTTHLVTRVLGGRLVLQAVLDLALGRRTRVPDVLVDLTHAASMLPAAALWRDHRRSALASAALATGIAVLDLCDTPGPGDARVR